jgi:hypothetical protein
MPGGDPEPDRGAEVEHLSRVDEFQGRSGFTTILRA